MRGRLGLLVAGVFAGVCGMSGLANADGYGPVGNVRPWSWNGFYVGGNGGYAWGRDNVSSHFCDPVAIPIDCVGVSAAASPSLQMSGFIGGGQLGYNWQAGSFVFGGEADLDYMGLRGSTLSTQQFPSTPGLPFFFTTGTSASTDWLFTLRARAGVTAGNILFYGTGGLAVGNVKFNQTIHLLAPFVEDSSVSATKAGWTVGGGAEIALDRHWSAKAEYLYVDLGKVESTGTLVPPFPGAFLTNSAQLTTNIFRVGLNYKFGGEREYAPLK